MVTKLREMTMKPTYGITLPCDEFPHTAIVSFKLFGDIWENIELACTVKFFEEYQSGQHREIISQRNFLYAERGEDYYGIPSASRGSFVFLDKPGYVSLGTHPNKLKHYDEFVGHPSKVPVVSDRVFTLVGSRETPKEISLLMRELAKQLLANGWDGYSGASGEADKQLEQGYFYNFYNNIKQGNIYCFLPWGHFDNLFKYQEGRVYYNTPLLPEYNNAKQIAKEHYDKYNEYNKLSIGAKGMMNRNVYQILGPELARKTNIVFYWAKPATTKNMICNGGTNLAVALAEYHNIPTLNLYFPWVEQRLHALLNSRKSLNYSHAPSITLDELLSDRPISAIPC